jgi:hypothetical protein
MSRTDALRRDVINDDPALYRALPERIEAARAADSALLPPSALPLRGLDNDQIGIHGIHPRQLMVRVGRNCCTSSICSSRHCPSRLTKGTR